MNFDLGETDEQGKDRKMIKPPQVDHNNWVLLKDPKSKEAKIPPLSKSQVRKIQRRYTACHGKATSMDKKQVMKTEVIKPVEEIKPNPRFNREKAKEDNKHQIPTESGIEKENETVLTDATKKLLNDEEGGFESFSWP